MKYFAHFGRYSICFLVVLVFLCRTLPVFAADEKITLVSEDGYRIVAVLTEPEKKPASPSGAVLIHMYRQTKESWNPLVNELTAQGITSLAIDLRGHGESRIAPDGSDSSSKVMNRDPEFFNKMYRDAAAALKYLQENRSIPPERTALVGASVGCSIAIRTAIDHPVAGVVVMTPGRDYLGIPTMEHIRQWPNIPLLILTSKEEADKGANSIYEALKDKGAELIIFDKERIHGTGMFGEVKEVEKKIANWLTGVFAGR